MMDAQTLGQLGLREVQRGSDRSQIGHAGSLYAHTHSEARGFMRNRFPEIEACGLWRDMPTPMSTKIANFRRVKGWNQTELAERLGVTQGTVSRWEKGAQPEPDMLVAIARELGITVEELVGADGIAGRLRSLGPTIFVKGEVAAGRWVDAYEWPRDEWEGFTGRPDLVAEIDHRFGLLVQGDSMNEIYPSGTIIECVSVFGHAEVMPGRRVVIVRRRSADNCLEATVKELVEIDGVMWARPRSSNPSHEAFRLDAPGAGITEVRIVAVVVAAIRME